VAPHELGWLAVESTTAALALPGVLDELAARYAVAAAAVWGAIRPRT
jgi:hypothetical protein